MSSSRDILRWFVVALAIKLCFFLYFAWAFAEVGHSKIIGNVFVYSNDYYDYIKPVEELVDHGTYTYKSAKGTLLFAHRMPGFVPIYGPLYWLFGREWALIFFSIANLLADAATVLLAGLLAYQITKSRIAFFVAFFGYALCGYVSFNNHYALSESLTTFFLLLGVYLAFRATKNGRWQLWFGSGVFIAWAIFMRPASMLFLMLFPLSFLMVPKSRRTPWQFLKYGLIFALPLILSMSAWTARNYAFSGRFIPLAITLENFGTPEMRALYSLVRAWGGDIMAYHGTERSWFLQKTGGVSQETHQAFLGSDPFDPAIYTSAYDHDSLVVLRNEFWSIQSAEDREQVVAKIQRFEKAFWEETSIFYIAKSRLRLLFKFVFVRQVFNSPFNVPDLFSRLNKAFFLLNYYFLIIFGIAGGLISLFKEKWGIILFTLIGIHSVAHAVVLAYIEHRYLIVTLPLFAVLAGISWMHASKNATVKRFIPARWLAEEYRH